VIFDSDLTFKNHISDVCRSSFYHIRQLRQIRASLDTNSAVLLANALVSSKLDYCNSLFYNLPAKFLNRLQLVQNALARVVVPSVRRNHHITPTLRHLHWLPIPQRITFKIAFITLRLFIINSPLVLLNCLLRAMISLIILDHPILQIFSLFLYSILNKVEDLSFTQLPLSGTPYLILFVLLCLFHHFCLGLRLIFSSIAFLSFRTDFLDFGTGTDISLCGSVISSQGWCVCILLWPLRRPRNRLLTMKWTLNLI